jgi:hypothetical protein
MTIEIDVTERPKPKLKPNPLLGVDPEKLALFKENFDIESVAKEGLSDEQVVPLIQAAFEGEIDFDKAREVTQGIDDDGNLLFEENGKPLMVPGYTNREIIQLFTKSSSKDIGGALLTEFGRGTTKGTTMTLGAATGLKLGAPGGPIGMGILGTVGAITGYMFGEELQKAFFPQETYAPSVRPFAEGAKTVGEGLPMVLTPSFFINKYAPGTINYIRTVSGLSGRVTPLDKMLLGAAQKPVRTAVQETTALAGSGMGAALSENQDPGNALQRFGAEVGMGLFSPISIGANLLEALTLKGAQVFGDVTASQTRQGNALRSWLLRVAPLDLKKYEGMDETTREIAKKVDQEAFVSKIYQKLSKPDDVTKLAKELGIVIPEGFTFLPGRTTASVLDEKVIYGLQTNLGLSDPESATSIRSAIEMEYQGLNNLTKLMELSGDPQLILQASQARQSYFKDLILKKLDAANIKAKASIEKISPTMIRNGEKVADPRAAMKASGIIELLTDQALTDVRKYETELYDKVDKSDVISLDNFVKEYDELLKQLLDNEQPVPPLIAQLIGKAKGVPVELAEDQANLLAKINGRIESYEDNIRNIRAVNPQSVEKALSRYTKDVPLEQQLSEIQDAIRLIEQLTPKQGGLKGPEKNRQLSVLKNKAKGISATLEKNDLSSIMPSVVEPEDITLGEAMRARSLLLNRARGYTANSKFDEARIFSDLADALKDDFGIAVREGSGDYSKLTRNQKVLREAFEYSKSMNDVFSRAFPATVLGRSKTGARKLMPELLSKATFSGGGDATSLKYDQLDEAMKFAANELGPNFSETAYARIGSMRAAEDTLLRSKFEELIDKDGLVTEESLYKFNTRNRNIFFDEQGVSRFKALTDSLKDVESAQASVNLYKNRQVQYQAALDRDLVLSNAYADGTNIEKLVSTTLGKPGDRSSTDPTGAFKSLIKKAQRYDLKLQADGKKTGAGAGLFDVILQTGMDNATTYNTKSGDPSFDFKSFSKYLTEPLTYGGSSPLIIMQQEGLITSGQAARLALLLQEGVKTQGRRGIAQTTEDVSAVKMKLGEGRGLDIFVRLLGLRVGRKLTQMAPGQGQGLAEPQIIANEAAALLNIPRLAHKDVLIEAINNPEMFKLLLEKTGPSGSTNFSLKRRFNTFLLNSGFISAEEYKKEQERGEQQDIPGITSPVVQRERSPVVQTVSARSPVAPTDGATSAPEPRPFIVAQMPTAQQPSAPQARPSDRSGVASLLPEGGAQSNASSQERYAAAYPYDSISDVIRMRGTA